MRDQDGVSIVELLVVMVVAAVVGSAMVASVSAVGRAEQVALDLRQNTDAGRVAVERIRDVVREAYGVCDGSDPQRLELWRRDLDGNDRIDPPELVTFAFVGDELRRTDGVASPRIVATGVAAGASFTYLDRDGLAVDTPVDETALDCTSAEIVEGRGDVGTVRVRMSGERRADRGAPTVVDTQITLRNAAIGDGVINPNRPPVASFSQTCSGLTCTFDASSSYDEDGEIVAYSWDYGYGASGTGLNPTHIFPTYSSYSVTLSVTDDEGAVSSQVQFVTLAAGNATPSASFTMSCGGLTCSMDASASFDADGEIVSYEWDFGDDQNASGPNLKTTSHTYEAAGTYPVTLTVHDDGGLFGTEVKTANPTTGADAVRIVSIESTSSRNGDGSAWIPRVLITVQFSDGAPANAVKVNGRFGPENSTDLRSANTNAEGSVSLQANGEVTSSSYLFTVLSVDGYSLTSDSQVTLLLTPP
jgi:PKD repeat protein